MERNLTGAALYLATATFSQRSLPTLLHVLWRNQTEFSVGTEGISPDEAQRIADFLNEHLLYVAITRFGDAEDAAMDVKQSEHLQRVDLHAVSAVITMLKEKLAANDVPAAVEAMKAVESVIEDLITDWSRAIVMSRAILRAFGKAGGDQETV